MKQKKSTNKNKQKTQNTMKEKKLNTQKKPEKQIINEKTTQDKTNTESKTKETKFSQKNKLLLFGIIFALIIVVLVFFFINQPKYSFVLDGVKYVSNDYTPTEFFKEFKTKQTVYVSPVMLDTKADPIVVNALNLWQIVLIGNNIGAVQLIRTTNEHGTLLHCYTNDGNVYVNKQISLQECNAIINDANNVVILLEIGNEKKAVLSKNKLIVYSPINAINATNFSIMKQIFPNAEEVVRIVNESVYGL
jgi:hypothetical protein